MFDRETAYSSLSSGVASSRSCRSIVSFNCPWESQKQHVGAGSNTVPSLEKLQEPLHDFYLYIYLGEEKRS